MGRLNIDTILMMIDQGHVFYTRPTYGAGQRIIAAVRAGTGRRYLKTIADGIEPNNILVLPRCPQ